MEYYSLYLVLLPVGFTLPPMLPSARCALTTPFHPYQPSLKRRRAVFFLWHYPWGRPRRVLPGTVFPWSPDFPLSTRRAAIRPSGGLEYRLIKSDAELKMTRNNLKPRYIAFPSASRPSARSSPSLGFGLFYTTKYKCII